MDFFERAHVARNRDNKHKKDEQTMKKQLKLMLQGYKTSNTDVIKEAENITVELDDSTSVSGFSDLNLTSSTIEEDTSIKELSGMTSDAEKESNFHENSFTSDHSRDESKSISSNDNRNNINVSTAHERIDLNVSRDSSYEGEGTSCSNSYNEDIQSLSNMEDILNDSEFHSSDNSSTGSSQSKFDSDGKLALQILKKLKTKDLKKDKRKFIVDDTQSDLESLPEKEKKKHRKVKTNKRQKTVINSEHSEILESINEHVKNTAKINQAYPQYPSPPYVSITAADLQPQRFDDILGDYKHSTMRIVPFAHQNPILTSGNSSLFTVECASANITMEKDSSTICEGDLNLNTNLCSANQIAPTQNTMFEEEHDVPSVYDEELSELDEANNYMMYFVRNNCIVVLKHPAELYFHGKLVVQSLGGHVEVGGFMLKDEECSIVAPVYSYAQCLRTVEDTNDYNGLLSKLTKAGLSLAEAKEIVTNIGVYDGILLLKPFRCPKMDFIANNFTSIHLFKYVNKDSSLERASNVLGCSLYSKKPLKCLEENPAWKTVIEVNPSLPFKVLTCGGKGSGKSTFVRYYINRLLRTGPVLVIDLDPGQSEFTVAGHVSATVVDSPIFGPSFTHLRSPQRALNIGMISTMDNINRYVNAVKSIVSYSKEHFSQMPWVINTMGMTNALGLQIIALIIITTEPNFVLQYDSNNPKKRFNTHLSVSNVLDLYRKFRNSNLFRSLLCPNLEYTLVMAPNAESITKCRSLVARDERYLNFLAYFGELAINIKPDGWLLEITPYEVCLNDLYIAVNIPFKDCITKVINGKVVGLCQHNLSTQYKERVFTLSVHPLLCHGHGLIRGIDWEKQVLYVITPMPASKLGEINTLLYADWAPDLKGQEVHLPKGTEVPYRMVAQQQQMELMTAPRRRFNPLQLLKMTRNSLTN